MNKQKSEYTADPLEVMNSSLAILHILKPIKETVSRINNGDIILDCGICHARIDKHDYFCSKCCIDIASTLHLGEKCVFCEKVLSYSTYFSADVLVREFVAENKEAPGEHIYCNACQAARYILLNNYLKTPAHMNKNGSLSMFIKIGLFLLFIAAAIMLSQSNS